MTTHLPTCNESVSTSKKRRFNKMCSQAAQVSVKGTNELFQVSSINFCSFENFVLGNTELNGTRHKKGQRRQYNKETREFLLEFWNREEKG